MDKLLERLKQFKYKEDISYKEVAADAGIPVSTMYNYTSGLRELKPKMRELLEEYLEDMGY